MRWIKQGLLYAPDGSLPWAQAYAFPPTPLLLAENLLRLYVCSCDDDTVGRIGYVDVDPADPGRILEVAERPVLDIGEPGCFDEFGLLPTCVLRAGEEIRMYYVGYSRGLRVPYWQFEGLARSLDGGATFERVLRVPVIDRSDAEPHHRTSAFVRQEPDGRYRMWYVAGDEWIEVNGKPLPRYNLRCVESDDGIRWPDRGRVVLDFANDDEHAFGRPWIVEDDGRLRLFYSIRTHSKDYRLGTALSDDGWNWQRRDHEVGIDVGQPDDWDGGGIAYGSVVTHGDRTYLFYNGSARGRTGFGWAILDGGFGG